MLIAKLTIALKNVDISYNSANELGTDKNRGAVLPGGQVVRGLGTHFKDKESKEKFEALTSEANAIRSQFNRQFVRTPIEGTFIIPAKGQGKFFIECISKSPDIEASVVEFELASTGEGLNAREMAEWGQRVKNQIVAIPLGRGEDVAESGLRALSTLADCPVMAKSTAESIRSLINKVRTQAMTRKEFKSALEAMTVDMDPSAL